MELDNYRNFLAIVEAGSFTGAAECVHIAQPALSKQIRVLENYFGTKLIITNRGSRQIILTEAGHALYQKAKYICSLEDLAKEEIDNIVGCTSGTLRISVANSRSALFITNALKDFVKLYPEVNYAIYEGSIAEQVQQLLNGFTEIGILSVPISHEDSFEILFKREEKLCAVACKKGPWLQEGKGDIKLQELENIPLSISMGCCEIIKKEFQQQGLTHKILCVNTTRSTALQWAEDCLAVALVPIEQKEKLGSNFIIRQVTDVQAEFAKTVVHVKGRPLSSLAKCFLRFYAQNRNSQQVCNLEKLLREV